MVDDQLRRTLSIAIRRLVAGRISNEDFDDLYLEQLENSDDPAIRNIGEFGYSLYSSDLPFAFRLRRRRVVAKGTKKTAARCALFLRTNAAYEWPPFPRATLNYIRAVAALIALPMGIALLIVGGLLLLTHEVRLGTILAMAGLLVSAVSMWSISIDRRTDLDTPAWQAWKAQGEFEVWPFINREQLNDACCNHHVLGASSSEAED